MKNACRNISVAKKMKIIVSSDLTHLLQSIISVRICKLDGQLILTFSNKNSRLDLNSNILLFCSLALVAS